MFVRECKFVTAPYGDCGGFQVGLGGLIDLGGWFLIVKSFSRVFPLLDRFFFFFGEDIQFFFKPISDVSVFLATTSQLKRNSRDV
jgi:hypothetical protein